jgi:hypothetical protein
VARSFVDRNGTHWDAWETNPTSPTLIAPELAQGWLTFLSHLARRRLFPVPKDWENATDERLELMCRAAAPVDDDSE